MSRARENDDWLCLMHMNNQNNMPPTSSDDTDTRRGIVATAPPPTADQRTVSQPPRKVKQGRHGGGAGSGTIMVVSVVASAIAVIAVIMLMAMMFIAPNMSGNDGGGLVQSDEVIYDGDMPTSSAATSGSSSGVLSDLQSFVSGDHGGGAPSADVDVSGDDLSTPGNSERVSDLDGEQKIAYSADAYLETVDFADASSKLDAAISDAGAVRIYDDYDDVSRSVDLRVPTDRYDAFIDALPGVATVVRCSESADNITSDYNDLEARIDSLKTQQSRLNELMSQAASVDDMLAIEDRQQDVSYELESASRSLAEMDADVDYAVVSVKIKDVSSKAGDGIVGAEEDFATLAGKAFQQSIDDFGSAVKDFAVTLISSWTWILAAVILLAIVVAILVSSARRSRKQQDNAWRGRSVADMPSVAVRNANANGIDHADANSVQHGGHDGYSSSTRR